MKRVIGNFSFDFISDSSINKKKLECKLVLGLNDAFASILHDLDIEIWNSEPTEFDPIDVENLEDDDPLPYSSAVNP